MVLLQTPLSAHPVASTFSSLSPKRTHTHTHTRVCTQLFDWNLAEMFTASYLWSVFGDFPDKCGNILLDIFIWVFEAGEDCREDLSLHHHLSQVDRMLGDLTQG